MGINYNKNTRIPVNDEYATLVGKAAYVFAYYEWIVIYIINYFKKGFVSEYSRPERKPLTSGGVNKVFREIINKHEFPVSSVTKKDIENCQEVFQNLIEKRNALIHAHPITAKDGSQILGYQTTSTKAVSDVIWTKQEVEKLISEFDTAAVEAGHVFDILRKT